MVHNMIAPFARMCASVAILALLVSTAVRAFRPILFTYRSMPLSAITEGSDPPTPFFADTMPLPFFASQAEQTSPEVVGSTTVTTRVPLGTLFDSRDYIFTAATNVRGYEWTLKQIDELFEDLSDVSIGDESPNRHRGDYELSQIVLVPMQWDRAEFGLGGRYDVHDGQQRLVSLCLLFAALRESFRKDAGETEETVEELTAMLNPRKTRKSLVLRIELRNRDNEMLRRILTPELVDGEDGEIKLNIPSPEDKELTLTNKRILTNYDRLVSHVSSLNVEQRLGMLDYLIEHVYLLVCVPETATIARNIVMSQGKGMNTEPIDDFKGLVCFRYTRNEEDMYNCFDKWDTLSSQPNSDTGAVGRGIVSSACLLRASVALRTRIRKNGEAFALEDWLRQDLIKNSYEGNDFYMRNVEPASRVLHLFRDSAFDSFKFANNRNKPLVKIVQTRLSFLRGLTSGVASTKEIEMVVLDLLLGAEEQSLMSLERLDDGLACAEVVALWMAMMRPSLIQKHQRCFDIIEANNTGLRNAVVVSFKEKAAIKDQIKYFGFGASPSGKKIAIPLLERLNSQILLDEGSVKILYDTPNFIEHILPTNTYRKYWSTLWPDEQGKKIWTHLLGNLALVTRKSTAKECNNSFTDKKGRYVNEASPLTRYVSEIKKWDKISLVENHEEVLSLLGKIWDL